MTERPPKWIEPCIPTLISKPPKGPNWRHEIKWDGYRISIVINERTIKVRTRKGLDWTEKFPTIVDDATIIPRRNAIIDGEALVLDDKGRANFAALQANLSEGGENVVAYVFDLLFLDGQDLLALPLGERRKTLEKLIGRELKFGDSPHRRASPRGSCRRSPLGPLTTLSPVFSWSQSR